MLLSRAHAGTRSKRRNYSAETKVPNPRSPLQSWGTRMGVRPVWKYVCEVDGEYFGALIFNTYLTITILSLGLSGPDRYIPRVVVVVYFI